MMIINDKQEMIIVATQIVGLLCSWHCSQVYIYYIYIYYIHSIYI